MDTEKSLAPAFEALIKSDQGLSGARPPQAVEPGDDVVAAGALSIGEIEKLMEELSSARDYLRAEGERVRRINARYAHLTRTASASVKIIAESMSKWRTSEADAGREADGALRRNQVPANDGKPLELAAS
jgi:hypothetical protein